MEVSLNLQKMLYITKLFLPKTKIFLFYSDIVFILLCIDFVKKRNLYDKNKVEKDISREIKLMSKQCLIMKTN